MFQYFWKWYLQLQWLVICSTLGYLKAMLKWHDSQIPSWIGHIYGPVALRLAGVELVVEGQENLEKVKGPVVFVSNHQGTFDLAVFSGIVPPRTVCIAKSSLKYMPMFGLFWYAAGNIFIERADATKSRNTMDGAVKQIKSGDSVWVFAEGTRNFGTKLREFKKGAFHVAIQAQVPVVPVIVSPYNNVVNWWSKEFPGGTLKVKFLPPLPTTGLTATDVDNLLTQSHQCMATQLAVYANEMSPQL